MSVLLSVSEAKKSIGPRQLFAQLSFGLMKGDRVGLVGPNGAGKSTLLRILAGRDTLDSGKVVWSSSQKRVYIAQSLELKSSISVRDFLSNGQDLDQKQEAMAWELIAKLGSRVLDWEDPVNSLSGGEQKKLQIIQGFLVNPDIVLMDEPTNHLDVESIQMLEEFLENTRDKTFLIISHDRLFLQNVVTEVMDLDSRYKDGYLRIKGGYAEYIEARQEIFRSQVVTQQRLENDLRREVEWLRRGAIARLKKQKARQDSAHELMKTVDQYSELNRKRDIAIDLKSDDRIPKKLIEIENMSLKVGDRVLFEGLNLVISRGSRIGLLGRNGSGKSSFIQAILGRPSPGLTIGGMIKRFEELKVSYFEQQRGSLQFEETLLHNLCPMGDYVHVHGQALHVRSYLDRFRFRRDQHDLKVKELSGGEQNRLLLARLMTEKVQLMVLDEPTNDLDFETLQSLKKSLDEFDGAVILVSHDRTFMDEICDQILYFNEDQGRLEMYASFFQWQAQKLNKNEPDKGDPAKTGVSLNSSSASQVVSQESKSGPKRKLSYKEIRELEGMEAAILELEERLTVLQNELSKPEVQVDSQKLIQITASISELEKQIEKKYQRWQELN
jgi:ATP-binding cassette subfamily F protein uup